VFVGTPSTVKLRLRKLPADRGDVAQQRLFDRTIFEPST